MLYGVLLLCAGNDILHLMTSVRRQRLRVDLADWDGSRAYAEFDNFRVGSFQEKYPLVSLGSYTGSAGMKLKNVREVKGEGLALAIVLLN